MKKYQLWLERKTYSQHLNNLLRIKLSSSLQKLRDKTILFDNSSHLDLKDKSMKRDMSSFCLTTKDLSYIITARELQNHKMRLVRSNEIVRQNKQMVKRINNTKPFISTSKPIVNNNYKLKRKMQRANEKQDKIIKYQNYKQFLKVQNQNLEMVHKYKLIIIIEENQLIISSHKCTELFLEVVYHQIKRKSQSIKPSQFNHYIFKFALTDALPQEITLNVHQFKNLDHSIIASYNIKRPQEGKTQQYLLMGSIGINKIKMKIRYMHLKPKFINLDHFKI